MYLENHLANRVETDYPRDLVRYLTVRFGLGGADFRMVDLGCGLGGYTKAWGSTSRGVFAIDIESVAIPDVETAVADLMRPVGGQLPADWPMGFDLVVSKSVLEHLPDARQFLRNAKYLAKPNGLVLIMVPDWRTGYKTFYDDYTHVRPYTTDSLLETMRLIFGPSVSVEVLWQVPFAWKYPRLFSAFRWIRWFLPPGDLRNRMTVAALLSYVRV